LTPQPAFFAGHLAIIALVIEARQMQDAVQRQNFHLVCHRMTQAPGVLPGNVRRDRYFPGNAFALSSCRRRGGKRQYVRGFVCSPESLVQRPQLGTAGDQDIHRATQPNRAPRPQYKSFER
jgi:hypothetical protein